jgi:hypothetical protein
MSVDKGLANHNGNKSGAICEYFYKAYEHAKEQYYSRLRIILVFTHSSRPQTEREHISTFLEYV